MSQKHYSETIWYRCLNEYFPHPSEELYLILCGVEQCTADKERINRIRDGYHLHVIMSGEGVVETNGVRQVLHAGQMFLIKPGERISYWPVPEQPWCYCWMSFNGALAGDYIRSAGFLDNISVLDCHVETNRFYQLCDKTLNQPLLNTAAALQRLGLLFEFIGLAIESHEKTVRQINRREPRSPHHKSDYVRYAVDYMENNYATSMSVAEVSDYLGIDRSYFSVIFKQIQGLSPNEFLLRIRMRKSIHFLQNPSMPIREIAHQVGYEDALTFSKAFKRFFGVSPKSYRELPAEQRQDMAGIDKDLKRGNENADADAVVSG